MLDTLSSEQLARRPSFKYVCSTRATWLIKTNKIVNEGYNTSIRTHTIGKEHVVQVWLFLASLSIISTTEKYWMTCQQQIQHYKNLLILT